MRDFFQNWSKQLSTGAPREWLLAAAALLMLGVAAGGALLVLEFELLPAQPTPAGAGVSFLTPTPAAPLVTATPVSGPGGELTGPTAAPVSPTLPLTLTLFPTPTSTLSPTPTFTPSPPPTFTPTWTPSPTAVPFPTATPVPIITEWRGEYWANPELRGRPVLVRNDPAIDFNWGRGAPAPELPADNFSARWSRRLTFRPGLYRFFVRADDGVRLYVNGDLILNAWDFDEGRRLYTVDRRLSGRRHLEVEYFEERGAASIEVDFQPLAAPTATPSPTATPTTTPNPESVAVEAAISHLSALTGVSPMAIRVISIEAVTWPDTELGCPAEPGVGLPVLTPGYRIVLEARETRYIYHTNREGRVRFCPATPTPGPPPLPPTLTPTPTATPEPVPPPPSPTPTPDPAEVALDAAIDHLVGLTNLPAAEIEVVSIEAVEWPNTQLGCPPEEVVGAPVITPGYRIILTAGGQRYEYHTDRSGRVVLC